MSDSHAFTAPTLVGTELFVRDRRFLTAFDLSPQAVAAAAEGKGRAFRREDSGLPAEVASLLGTFETSSSGIEPSRVNVLVENGWLVLDLPDQASVRLALQPDGNRWEFVEDRTSGSAPRTIEFQRDEEGAAASFVLRSPFRPEREYRVVH